jgi:hypothetical protein
MGWSKKVNPTKFTDFVGLGQVCPSQMKDASRGDHWAKIVEQRAIINRVQCIHCRYIL